jgi:ribonuclease T1
MKVSVEASLRIAVPVYMGVILQLFLWVAPQQEVLAYSHGGSRHATIKEMPTIEISQLPQEARHSLDLIKLGGPFPYPKDGTVFGNRERRLPPRPLGHYKEYTVKTPGSRDRGARRIIAGADGEYYYTEDHYNTFKLIRGVLP